MRQRLAKPFLAILVFSTLLFNVSALDLSKSELRYSNEAIRFAALISQNIEEFSDWKSITLGEELYLYNEAGNKVNAVIFDVYCNGVNSGYILIDYNTKKVLEFSREASPYGSLLEIYKSKKGLTSNDGEYCVYTPGLHGFAAKARNASKYTVYDFVSDQSVRIDLPQNRSSSQSTLSNAQTLTTGIHKKILSDVPDTDWMASCIPTAIGNVIGYWDTHGYPNLIVSPDTITSVIYRIDTNLILACGSNTNNSAIPTVVQNYCRASGRYPNNFTVTNIGSPTFTTFKSQITYNRPALVGFASGNPTYQGAHMTVGVGYYYDDAFPNEKYIYVHDAWSNTAVNYFVLWGSYNDFIAKIVP